MKTAQKNGTKKTTKSARRMSAKSGTKQSKTGEPRKDSKTAILLGLLRRESGATISELMKAESWQAHSVRGFLSAHVGKKLGLPVHSEKNEPGERTYRLLK